MHSERPQDRGRRRDAANNRQAIIDAAREVFARQGVDVALEEIAKQAGVGLATVHRHFTRTELVEAVFTARAEEYLRIAEQPGDGLTGWAAFAAYLERLCEIQAADRAASDVLTLRLPACQALADLRDRIYYAQLDLIRGAQREGSLREDLVPEDVILVLLAVGGVVQATSDTAPDAWKRILALLLAALRSSSADGELPAAPSGEALLAALKSPLRGRRPSGLGAATP